MPWVGQVRRGFPCVRSLSYALLVPEDLRSLSMENTQRIFMSIMRKKARPFRGGSALMEDQALTGEMAGPRRLLVELGMPSCVGGPSVDL